MICPPQWQSHSTPDFWNPLPGFQTVQQDGQLHDVTSPSNYFQMARKGRLPSVSWIVPNGRNSEHPPASIANGQAWVTRIVNAAMKSPDWKHTAIFLSWDDWGGFYDHVVPPSLNAQGLGLRVPGLVISPYAQSGMIDHQTLSTDSTSGSSRTTSWTGSGSTPRRTAGPTAGRSWRRRRRGSATCWPTSTSRRSRCRR